MTRFWRLSIAFGACGVWSCASKVPPRTPEPEFLRATPLLEDESTVSASASESTSELVTASEALERDEPRVVAVPPSPPRQRSADPSRAPEVIARANDLASQSPVADGFLNAVMTYTYVPGGIYKVFTAPQNVTDLVLEPGEELTGEPAAGDTLRWRLGVGASAVNGVPQKHVFIKPTRPGLSTNLTLNTNRRTYFLQLESLEETYMVAVQWTYPHDDRGSGIGTVDLAGASTGRTRAEASELHFGYAIEIVEGQPSWKPQAVYDDGKKTYIRFHPNVLRGESPALFVIQRGEMQLVNYRVKQNLYVVDRLFQVAELRLGQDDQDIVRITRK